MRDYDHHECCSSSSSSIDSNYYNYTSSSTSLSLSTDLRLGLTISSSSSTLIDSSGGGGYGSSSSSLLVKVYMEGIAIGRKLDLMTLDGYHSLVVCLSHMFKTPITLYSDENKLGCCRSRRSSDDHHNHVVVYEDKEGDWLLVGDVPWQLFLTSVKRLKITKYVEPC